MLAKKQRLRKQKEIQATYGGRLSFFDSNFGLKAQFNNKKETRFAVVIGKKISKEACTRNKVKRRVKYVLKNYRWRGVHDYDILILCLKGSGEQSFINLKNQIENLLLRLETKNGIHKKTN